MRVEFKKNFLDKELILLAPQQPLPAHPAVSLWVGPLMNEVEGEIELRHNPGEPAEKLHPIQRILFFCNSLNKLFIKF